MTDPSSSHGESEPPIMSGTRRVDPSEDSELLAAQALHARIQRTRKRASLVCLLCGLALGIVLCIVLQGMLADLLGARIGTLALLIVFFAPLLAALKAAEMVADTTVNRSIAAWIKAVAAEHKVDESTLVDHARIAGAKGLGERDS